MLDLNVFKVRGLQYMFSFVTSHGPVYVYLFFKTMNACTPRKFVVNVNCSPKYLSICGDLFEIHIFPAAVNKYSHTLHIKHCAITLLYLSLEDVHVLRYHVSTQS